MDAEALKGIAKLMIMGRGLGISVSAAKMARDRVYASETLDKFDEKADEDGIQLTLTLRDKLGLLDVPVVTPAVVIPITAKVDADKDKGITKNYLRGPRG